MVQLISLKKGSLQNGERINDSMSVQTLLTPTTATLTLNVSGTPTPYGMTDSMIMFVNGLFSPQFHATASNTTYLPLKFSCLMYRSSPSPSPTGFVLPGTSFGIAPIGFYLFSAYWGAFTVIILWGAWNKRKVTLS